MLFVPKACKEVCGKAVKLALFFLLCSLGVFVYDEWFSLEGVNTQLHSSRVTTIMWQPTAISRPLSVTFSFERPPIQSSRHCVALLRLVVEFTQAMLLREFIVSSQKAFRSGVSGG
jgi:hypothetical protein